MNIKDKENIAEYNVWSCGRYSHNLDGFQISAGTEGTVTTNENGIKILRTTTNDTYFYPFVFITVNSEDIGKNITIKCSCKGAGNIESRCLKSDWSTANATSVNVPSNCSEIICTNELVQGTARVQFRFTLPRTANSILYLNNITITIQ